MSKQCPYCKSKKVGSFNDEVAVCTECHRVFGKSQLVDTTLFDQITQSHETLAEKLVVEYRHGVKDYAYYSTVTCELYNTRPEAIAATIEKLKGACDA